MRRRAALATVAVALALPAAAPGDDDDDDDKESVTRVSCVDGKAELRLREADDDDDRRDAVIAVRLRVDVQRPVFHWRLVLLHERRILFKGTRRSTQSGHSLRLARNVPDWRGLQTVAARLATVRGHVCRLEATI